MGSTETAIVRCELEMAQRALKLQTRRCRQLVSEYTRKLQTKELEAISERRLRDEQLTKVLRSLLVFEARLKQEQIFIRHQLEEKDDLIQRQRKELRGLRSTVQYCKTCSQFYYNSNIDSCDSSSEYCLGNNQEIWESGSELYGSISESGRPHSSGDDCQKRDLEDTKLIYEKNKFYKCNEGSYKRLKKTNSQRRMTGTYFEVLKSRESSTESSPEDASSDLSDSFKTKEQIEEVSERIEELFAENSLVSDTFSEKMDSLHGIRKPETSSMKHEEESKSDDSEMSLHETSIHSNDNDKNDLDRKESDNNLINDNLTNEEKENTTKCRNISETITVFDTDGEQNDWYASASDQEDDDNRDIYRNNPVLECMNQILLQNINDSINSPPKSPDLDRNTKSKTQKRVKFSDENESTLVEPESPSTKSQPEIIPNETEEVRTPSSQGDYYETPIQGGANFYEVPQSIYSNDYEQIMSKCSEDGVNSWSPIKVPSPSSKIENIQENKINRMATQKLTIPKCNSLDELENKSHYYIDMDTTYPPLKNEIVKKTKVARTPPALPPKPANLVSKFKMLNRSVENLEDFTVESEPDYCSISELNLPTEKMIISPKTIPEPKPDILLYDPISLDGTLTSIINKSPEKPNFQAPKQPQVKNERVLANVASIAQINMLKSKNEPEIPKLPQVSEIIIPEETEEKLQEEHISQDNYIKNNSQILKQTYAKDKFRNRINIGTSVSNLISSFNNQYNISTQMPNRKIGSDRYKLNEKLFSSFEYSQDYEKQQQKSPDKSKTVSPSFEKFDLSQNFEEFNLDDCEIGEEFQSESSNSLNFVNNNEENITNETSVKIEPKSTSIDLIKSIKDPHSNIESLKQLHQTLSNQRANFEQETLNRVNRNPEPSYEHFLECTGLSSKSILTPSRMLSNHKSMLKPKDIKLRSRSKSSAVIEHPNGTVKYWSEPYL